MRFWKKNKKRVMIIGLDCAAPELVFDQWLDELPNIRSLVQAGAWGPLRSCDPPITVPAWSCMMSSKSPGTLGVYGFRNRADYSYDKLSIANSTAIKADRVWDILSRAGKNCLVIGVPQTYPIRPINGKLVSCFLTPDTKVQYTYPPEFRDEVEKVVGEYIIDCRDFRSDNRDKILADIYEMTEKRFKLARHLLDREDWDFFMMVEMGTDRIHHAFWQYMDKTHRKHEPGHKFARAIHDYYLYLDKEIGSLLKFADENTTVLIVSDHGAKKMDGGVCVNEWLMREGYLTLAEKPASPVPLGKAKVDWTKTKVWGDGGYYARVFLNVKGREPQGTVDPKDYEALRDELIRKIEAIPDDTGKPMGTKVFKPQQLYKQINNVAPDLLVYFGDLLWRSVGSVGLNSIYTFENDTGPDDANHAQYGMFIVRPPNGGFAGQKLDGVRLFDVAPTVLRILDLPIPADMEGNVFPVYR